MADYYNISQLIEICPGSPAQMSLSESGSPWANIPTAPSAGCVHLTRKQIWLLLSRVCYLQHRYFYCNMDCCALQRGGLLSAKSDSWHTPCAGDLAVFPVTAVTPAIRKAKDTQYGAILRHISSIPCDPALAAFLFLRGYRYPAWRRAGCGRGYPLPLPCPHRPRLSGWQRCGAGCGY